MNSRVTMNQEDSMILQRDTFPMQVLNKLMDWIMDGKLKMGEKLNTEELADYRRRRTRAGGYTWGIYTDC